jgi:hypothetical protein
VKDSLSLGSVSFVEIYSENGSLVGVSDKNGFISDELIKEIERSNKKVTFVHSNYKNYIVDTRLIEKISNIFLTPIYIKLNEVVITRPHKNKYLKLTGYFRSVQSNEKKPHYFIDGLVSYFINLESGKVKMTILSNRSLDNKNIKQLSDRYYFLLAGVPSLNEYLTYSNLSKEYSMNEIKQGDIKIKNKEGQALVGSIVASREISNLQLEVISNQNPKIMKFLGMESHLNRYIISSVYSTPEINDVGFDNILYFKEIRDYDIRKKKKDNFTKIEAIHEFFVIEKGYINNIDAKKFDDFYTFKLTSSYKYIFWNKIDNKLFQPIPKSLELFIEQNLTESKK